YAYSKDASFCIKDFEIPPKFYGGWLRTFLCERELFRIIEMVRMPIWMAALGVAGERAYQHYHHRVFIDQKFRCLPLNVNLPLGRFLMRRHVRDNASVGRSE